MSIKISNAKGAFNLIQGSDNQFMMRKIPAATPPIPIRPITSKENFGNFIIFMNSGTTTTVFFKFYTHTHRKSDVIV
jgi:hypothetical protein